MVRTPYAQLKPISHHFEWAEGRAAREKAVQARRLACHMSTYHHARLLEADGDLKH